MIDFWLNIRAEEIVEETRVGLVDEAMAIVSIGQKMKSREDKGSVKN